MSNSNLHLRIAVQLLFFVPFAGLLLFLPAGTFEYWEAWGFIAVFFVCNVLLTVYLAVKDPRLLERRMKAGPRAETSTTQKIIAALAFALFAAVAVLPALDHRFGWSKVPTAVVIMGDVLIVLSYCGFYRVFRENTYGAATIQVEKGQTVISTGPYGVVRHPMYSAGLILFFSIPLALGSWWGVLILIPSIVVLAWRLLDEEKFLQKNLPGYTEYMQRVRYRLVPYVW
jgi:protein-S-isoprenylcysteine O-methyltransferase Ste14